MHSYLKRMCTEDQRRGDQVSIAKYRMSSLLYEICKNKNPKTRSDIQRIDWWL